MSQTTADAYKTLGRGFSNEEQYAKLSWSFAADGGEADNTISLGIAGGKIMITRSLVHVTTTCVGASGTCIIGVYGGDTDAFLDITSGAVANLVDDAVLSETTGQGIVLAADAVISMDIATTDFSAGAFDLHVWYVNVD